MGFRFRRSFRLMPGIRLNVSKSGVSTSIGRRGAWLTFGPRGTRATVGIPGTGVSYTEQSAWSRPAPTPALHAPGIEVTGLPRVEIDIPPIAEPAVAPAPAIDSAVVDEDAEHGDPRLLPIVLAFVALITAAVVFWATLV